MIGIFLLASVALIYLIYDGVVGAGNIEKTGVLPFHTLVLRTLVSYHQVASMIRLYDMKLPAAVDVRRRRRNRSENRDRDRRC